MKTREHLSTYKKFDVVLVPFPFSDKNKTKNRPALVISDCVSNTYTLAMITSAANTGWKYDVPILDVEQAGVFVPCLIRMKLFTLDERLLKKKIGQLGPQDQKSYQSNLKKYLKIK